MQSFRQPSQPALLAAPSAAAASARPVSSPLRQATSAGVPKRLFQLTAAPTGPPAAMPPASAATSTACLQTAPQQPLESGTASTAGASPTPVSAMQQAEGSRSHQSGSGGPETGSGAPTPASAGAAFSQAEPITPEHPQLPSPPTRPPSMAATGSAGLRPAALPSPAARVYSAADGAVRADGTASPIRNVTRHQSGGSGGSGDPVSASRGVAALNSESVVQGHLQQHGMAALADLRIQSQPDALPNQQAASAAAVVTSPVGAVSLPQHRPAVQDRPPAMPAAALQPNTGNGLGGPGGHRRLLQSAHQGFPVKSHLLVREPICVFQSANPMNSWPTWSL